ncbi:hypothetical protein EDC96DRAFT_513474 [Choanephora cucurbitarum]|nr:hypothetical protein EDC96DRAFT_513474 [Choanephora cucurbitarum]
MEFPELGKRCTAKGCNLYDFLPYTCVNCNKVFCQDHFKLQAHQCPSLNDPNFDIRVPICPLCEKPVPSKRGVDPNIRMNEHIQSNCTDLDSKPNNTCRKKGCSTKLLVPMQCTDCGLSFCVQHRLAVDHQCKGHTKQQAKPSNTTEKSQRIQQEIAQLQTKLKQGNITDREQLKLAKLLSVKDTKNGKCIVS